MFAIIVKIFTLIILCVIVPFIINRCRPFERVPVEICLFNYGFVVCKFYDCLWMKSANINCYSNYTITIISVEHLLFIIGVLQLILYIIINNERFKETFKIESIGRRILFTIITLTVCLLSLGILLFPEVVWG